MAWKTYREGMRGKYRIVNDTAAHTVVLYRKGVGVTRELRFRVLLRALDDNTADKTHILLVDDKQIKA